MAGIGTPAIAGTGGGGGGGSSTITSLLGIISSGQKNMAGSLSVAIASDQSAIPVSGTVSATQGTSPWVVGAPSATGAAVPANAFYIAGNNSSGNLTGVNIGAGDSFNNFFLTGRGILTQAYSTGTAGAQTASNVSGFAYVSVDIQTALSGGNTGFQISNDNSNWRSINLTKSDFSDFSNSPGNTNSMYSGSLQGAKWFRLNLGGSGGTAAGTVIFSSNNQNNGTIISNPVSNAPTLGDANTNSPNIIRDSSGNTLYQPSYLYGFNSSTWDRLQVDASKNLKVLPAKQDTFTGPSAFTITLASLASSTVGVGRQSTLVTGNIAQSALIAVKFTVGTSPTANTLVYVYLIRGDTTLTDDNAGASDAGLTVINAPLLGTILVSAATSNASYYGLFDTKFLGSLGPTFGIAIVNSSGATANATAGNFTAEYTKIA